jgi:predicted RNase H-like nuclease (RuvC/YqgF family)
VAEFYHKVKQEIEKGIATVSIKSKEVLEDIKIKKQVDALQDQIKTTKTELGQLVYSMFVDNSLDQSEINEKCKAITILKEKLTEKEFELSQLHVEAGEALGKTYCQKCKTEIENGSRYCGNCGEKAPD